MAETLTLYSFGDVDRSGKVRWLAEELGLAVEEERLALGDHRGPPYTELNPMGRVPAVRFRGEVLTESTAICHIMAESFDMPRLWVGVGEAARERYLFWLATFGETLEARLVECAISKAGLIGPEYLTLHAPSVKHTMTVLAGWLPDEGWLCGEAFTVADVLAGYSLRLAVQTELVERATVEPYLGRLIARPAAKRARVFDSLG